MKYHLSFQLFSTLSLASLLGAGCAPSMPVKPEPAPETVTTPMPDSPATTAPNPVPPPSATIPTDEEVEKMTVEERDEAMKNFLEANGPMPMDESEKKEAMMKGEEMKEMAAEKNGSFHNVVHAAGGSAKLVQKDGKWMVVLSDDFKTDSGPDLHVYVSGHADPRTSPDVHVDPSADLGRLASTGGAQAYDLGAIDPNGVKSIVIYCKPFKVVFSVATLQ
ncbi:DM13 domain-containing protein [Candidatus Uhrbacteria bacterium]|nr:DM13 domain-containing protein [Candidatus Uhrbacteria bacterium]